MVYRVQNHALDIMLPYSSNDALLITVNSHYVPRCVHIPKLISRDQFIQLCLKPGLLIMKNSTNTKNTSNPQNLPLPNQKMDKLKSNSSIRNLLPLLNFKYNLWSQNGLKIPFPFMGFPRMVHQSTFSKTQRTIIIPRILIATMTLVLPHQKMKKIGQG